MPPIRKIFRYDEVSSVHTPLDPLEDVTSWIRGLRSEGYTKGILRDVHEITESRRLRRSTRMVCAHADEAVSLLEQAFAGPPDSSFLPIYYALLDLAKIYIVAAGRRADLQKRENRYHGVSYDPGNPHRLMTDKITLHPRGVVPLFYEVLTGESWPLQNRGDKQEMRLRRYYPYLATISHEYNELYEDGWNLIPADIHLVRSSDPPERYWVTCRLMTSPDVGRRRIRFLRGMKETSDRKFRTESEDSLSKAWSNLVRSRRRYLIYTYWGGSVGRVALLPASNQQFRLPEELPLLLVFFHLGSVVRYDPVFMKHLEGSRDWGMLLTLRKHGTLRFLLLFWSFLHQKEFFLETG